MPEQTSRLSRADLRRIVLRIPRDVRQLMRTHQLKLAGGYCRSIIAGEKPNDIDLFGPSREVMEASAKDLAISRAARLHGTDNAFTVLCPGRTPVQFIHRWTYVDSPTLLEEFDFTIARAVVWCDDDGKWDSLCDGNYYADLAAKRLVYRQPQRDEDVGGSLLRVRKFLASGYFISAHHLGLVVARLMKGIDFDKIDPTDEQRFAAVIIAKLREVDPLLVVDGIDAVDDHESVGIAGDQE